MGGQTKHGPTTGYNPSLMTGASDSVGSITFPNGLIIKWGIATGLAATQNVTITFPTPPTFNACFQVTANGVNNLDFTNNLEVTTVIAASFTVRKQTTVTSIRWIAIGR